MKQPRRIDRLSLILIGSGLVLLFAGVVIYLGQVSSPAPGPADNPAPPATVVSGVATAVPPTLTPTLPPTRLPAPTPTPFLAPVSPVAAQDQVFDGEAAYQHVLAQVALGPRPTGTETGWATGDLIVAELKGMGWQVKTQEFVFQGIKGRNVIGKAGQGPVIILGAHYDTRPAADKDPDPTQRAGWIDGANDGASGVAVLLELARTLEPAKLKHEIWLAFFDAEDHGNLDGWPFSVGARQMAGSLNVLPEAVVVVDMIGDADQNIYLEHNSNEALRNEIWAVAGELGYEAYIIPQLKHSIIDDHLPFVERGIPAVDMIDFDYPAWHTMADTADKVTPESLERVGRTLEVWLEEKQ